MRIEKQLIDLDTSKVDFDNRHWGWCEGGHPLRSGEYAITYIADDDYLNETRYALPKCLNEMMNLKDKYGAEEAKRRIRQALA